jgi:formylglycine-generating enzyme required for sulfatase activity
MLRKYAVFRASRTASAGSKLPNGWGLFDMHGNVWEWCWDRYGQSPAVDPSGAAGVAFPEVRGGSWSLTPDYMRASDRHWLTPGIRYNDLGFRVARGQ